jgi:hypothetical protein
MLAIVHRIERPLSRWLLQSMNIPGAGALAVGAGPRVPDGFVRHIGGIEGVVVGG